MIQCMVATSLQNQPPVKAMTEAAPKIIHLLDRMGVMFNRTNEGLLDFRRFGGTLHHRTKHMQGNNWTTIIICIG